MLYVSVFEGPAVQEEGLVSVSEEAGGFYNLHRV